MTIASNILKMHMLYVCRRQYHLFWKNKRDYKNKITKGKIIFYKLRFTYVGT